MRILILAASALLLASCEDNLAEATFSNSGKYTIQTGAITSDCDSTVAVGDVVVKRTDPDAMPLKEGKIRIGIDTDCDGAIGEGEETTMSCLEGTSCIILAAGTFSNKKTVVEMSVTKATGDPEMPCKKIVNKRINQAVLGID